MAVTSIYDNVPESAFSNHFQRLCEHRKREEVESLDGSGFEQICQSCGKVFPKQESVVEMSGCMSLEEFMNVTYGPSTPVGLQSFLLPTIATGLKCRDKFVDDGHLKRLRKYTDILRLCERLAIPKSYADECMRLVLKKNKGMYSETKVLEILEGLLMHEPLMYNRVLRLQGMTHQAQQIRKYRAQIEELKRVLAKHGVPVRNGKVVEAGNEPEGEHSDNESN